MVDITTIHAKLRTKTYRCFGIESLIFSARFNIGGKHRATTLVFLAPVLGTFRHQGVLTFAVDSLDLFTHVLLPQKRTIYSELSERARD